MSVILRNVGHRFEDRPWLFRGVSTVLKTDRVYALVGPSGSGKSTLLAALSRQLQLTEGRVEFSGTAVCVFQSPVAPAARTTRDIAAFPLLARGFGRSDAYAKVDSLLELFKLGDLGGSRFRTLSGGQAQRLMIVRGIAAEPDILLIDEPTAQLDTETSATVSDVIGSTRSESRVVVVATHDSAMVAQCTNVLDLRELGSSL